MSALHLQTGPPIEAALRGAEGRAAARLEASCGTGLPQEVGERGEEEGWQGM
jgi:hypothetical protein